MKASIFDNLDFSEKEKQRLQNLKEQLISQYISVFPDPLSPKTIIILPSLTLDEEILSRTGGDHIFYEERLLCLLLLLRMPRTEIIYLSSLPIDSVIIDYYLHLLSGITGNHARKRLHLLSCYDASCRSLTEKVLERPLLIQKIKDLIKKDQPTHIAAYNVTPLEEKFSLEIGVPLYGCSSANCSWGSKSGSRKIFKQADVIFPKGYEDLYTKEAVIEALVKLKQNNSALKKAVIKLNEGFSGDGNAIFTYEGLSEDTHNSIEKELHKRIKLVCKEVDFELFFEKLAQMGGIVEEFLDGEIKTSPSVQCRITPANEVEIISTHDQVLGGESNQTYLGASFPANHEYAVELGFIGKKIAEELKQMGVLGRFGIDFMSIKEGNKWKHYAIEINLRKGGTTHPYLMLQFLTNGHYDFTKGVFKIPHGHNRYYFTTDNLISKDYKGISPEDLIDIAICHNLHFDATTQEGVMFHMLGALSEFGKMGVLCVGKTPEKAIEYYQETVEVLKF